MGIKINEYMPDKEKEIQELEKDIESTRFLNITHPKSRLKRKPKSTAERNFIAGMIDILTVIESRYLVKKEGRING